MSDYICNSINHVNCYRWNDDVRRLNIRVNRIRATYMRGRGAWGFYGTLASWFYRCT